MSDKVRLIIDQKVTRIERGTTVLAAATRAGVDIPTLCHHAEYPCQLCVVQIEGTKDLVRACSTPAEDGMVVATQSDPVRAHRKLRAAGVDADLHVYEGQSHADYAFVTNSPESHEHYAELNALLLKHLQR